MDNLIFIMTFVSALGCGLVAGAFFAFGAVGDGVIHHSALPE